MRMISPRRIGSVVLLAAMVVLPLVGCTNEVRDNSIVPTGSVILRLTDPVQTAATLVDPGIQAAYFNVDAAELTLEDQNLDLTFDSFCFMYDTLPTLPDGVGTCAGGTIIGVSEEPLETFLTVRFRMRVRRAEPLILERWDDADMDGVPNATDSCPLIPNPGQEDIDLDGIGDRCQTFLAPGQPGLLDSDFFEPPEVPVLCDPDNEPTGWDDVPDQFDNCPWVPNCAQRDSDIPRDGIGDACPAQEAIVLQDGSEDIEIATEVPPFQQPFGIATILLVDVNSNRALDCDWNAGVCDLITEEVRVCTANSTAELLSGCF